MDVSCNPPPILNHNSFSEEFIQNITFKGLFNENVTFGRNGDIEVGHYELYLVTKNQTEPFQDIGTWNSQVGFKLNKIFLSFSLAGTQSSCSNDCSPGLYPVYGIKKCCWKCVGCPKDHIKSAAGQHQCKKCPPNHLSNNNKTKCFPYIQDHLVRNSSNGYFIYALDYSQYSLLLSCIPCVR